MANLPSNRTTYSRIMEALNHLDSERFTEVLTELTPMIPAWVREHQQMEHSYPSPSNVLRCRTQTYWNDRKVEPDQVIPAGWKLRSMMGIIQEPMWIALLKMAGFDVTLPEASYKCGRFMKAHPDGIINGTTPVPVEFKSMGGVGFRYLIEGNGVVWEQPDHFIQLQLYMYAVKADFGLYLASTPDPGLLQSDMRKHYGPGYELSPFYVEWVARDDREIERGLVRAEKIHVDRASNEPPMREYSGLPTNSKGKRIMPCGFCPFVERCNQTFEYGEGLREEDGITWQ